MTDTESQTGAPPKGTLSGPVRFFLVKPGNLLLGFAVIFLLSDALLPGSLATTAMGGGILGASFGIGTYPDPGTGRLTWRRLATCLAILDALAFSVGYGLASLAVYAGVTEEHYWAYILLLFLPWGFVDSLTPFVATRVAGLIETVPDEEPQP